MHILYMCRYACTCIVKYGFSMYVLCIDVCICMSTLKCTYTCSMIAFVHILSCKVYSYTSGACIHAPKGMRACIWHAGMCLACGHVFGMWACILACGHVLGMRACV